jgi:hypothetical protein
VPVHNDAPLIADLEGLPKIHLGWLFENYGIGRRRNKILVLARAMREAGVERYRYSYLGSTTGPITYYRYDGEWRPEEILERFRTANPEYLTELGARPFLVENGDPVINRVYRVNDGNTDEIVVELAARDVSHVYTQNWQQSTIVSDRGIRASIRGNPLTLEVRGTSNPDVVAGLVAPISGVGANVATSVRLVDNMEQQLKARLNAISRRSYTEHNDQVFSRARIEGRPTVDLQTHEQHQKFLADYGGKEYAHGYSAVIVWPMGYGELLEYKVDRNTGHIAIRSRNASEYALDQFRRHVLAL